MLAFVYAIALVLLVGTLILIGRPIIRQRRY